MDTYAHIPKKRKQTNERRELASNSGSSGRAVFSMPKSVCLKDGWVRDGPFNVVTVAVAVAALLCAVRDSSPFDGVAQSRNMEWEVMVN